MKQVAARAILHPDSDHAGGQADVEKRVDKDDATAKNTLIVRSLFNWQSHL